MKIRKGFSVASQMALDAWILSRGVASPDEIFTATFGFISSNMAALVVQEDETISAICEYSLLPRLNAATNQALIKWLEGVHGDICKQGRPASIRGVAAADDQNILFRAMLFPSNNSRCCTALIDVQAVLSSRGPIADLDDTDRSILQLLASGLSGKEIGQELVLSHRTIEHRIERLKTAHGARTIAHLVALSISSGL